VNKDGLITDDWMETQRKYWDNWMAMSRKAMGLEGGSATAPWEAALEHWWKAIAPAAPDASKDFMQRMIDQGKSFFKMAETFVPGNAGAGDAWTAFTKTLEDMQKGFRGSLDDGGNALHRLLAFWELPYDNWQRMVSSMSPVPGDFLRNMPHSGMPDNVDRLLSAPGLGYHREEQAQYQDLMRRSIDYQRALQDYLAFNSKLGMKAVERMRSYTQDLVQSGKTIDSARAIYDNWVNCCEAVYAEEVSTEEYAKLHGKLVNTMMAVKHRMAIMVDESLGALNMPPRSELRTLQDRLQETRRENKRMRRELHALQVQVNGLLGIETPKPGPRTALIEGAAGKKVAAKPAAAKAPAK